jgi:hypothetical protein
MRTENGLFDLASWKSQGLDHRVEFWRQNHNSQRKMESIELDIKEFVLFKNTIKENS